MNVMLFPFQRVGAKWLSERKKALLADEPGLGKTAQAIAAADLVQAKRILVLCPAIARMNWVFELEKFSQMKRNVDVFKPKNKFSSAEKDVQICSYDAGSIDALTKRGNEAFDLLILDEAHLVKSTEAKRTSAVLGKSGPVHRAKRVWALTGTPAPNHAGELWPLLYVFGATALSYTSFVKTYCECEQTTYGLQIYGTKTKKIPELKNVLSRIMLRRKKSEVLKDLPPIQYGTVVVEPGIVTMKDPLEEGIEHFSPQTIRREEEKVEHILEEMSFGTEDMERLAGLAQSVSTLRRYTGLQKVEPISELVTQELHSKAYQKIVIFCLHRQVIDQLEEKLDEFNPLVLHGGTTDTQRNHRIQLFQHDTRYQIIIANILTAGTAITLTAAHQVLFAEQDWVPANNSQAAQRCHRIGQTENVTVRFVSLANGVDQRVTAILKRKTEELELLFS